MNVYTSNNSNLDELIEYFETMEQNFVETDCLESIVKSGQLWSYDDGNSAVSKIYYLILYNLGKLSFEKYFCNYQNRKYKNKFDFVKCLDYFYSKLNKYCRNENMGLMAQLTHEKNNGTDNEENYDENENKKEVDAQDKINDKRMFLNFNYFMPGIIYHNEGYKECKNYLCDFTNKLEDFTSCDDFDVDIDGNMFDTKQTRLLSIVWHFMYLLCEMNGFQEYLYDKWIIGDKYRLEFENIVDEMIERNQKRILNEAQLLLSPQNNKKQKNSLDAMFQTPQRKNNNNTNNNSNNNNKNKNKKKNNNNHNNNHNHNSNKNKRKGGNKHQNKNKNKGNKNKKNKNKSKNSNQNKRKSTSNSNNQSTVTTPGMTNTQKNKIKKKKKKGYDEWNENEWKEALLLKRGFVCYKLFIKDLGTCHVCFFLCFVILVSLWL